VPLSDKPWADTFVATYEHAAEQLRTERATRRRLRGERFPEIAQHVAEAKERLNGRFDALKAANAANPRFATTMWQLIEHLARSGDPDAKLVSQNEWAAYWRAERKADADRVRAKIDARRETGFHWTGGAVGGNADYFKDSFSYCGLVSDEDPILRLFVTKVRRAKHLRTGMTKAESNPTRSKLLALDEAYSETNGVMRGVLRVEVDRIFPGWDAVASLIASLGVPAPNLAVGHADANGLVHRPHLLWIIEHSVPFTPKARPAHQRLFRGVLRSLTAALIPIGADPGGLHNPNRHKNPLSPLWDRRVLAPAPYSLERLRDGTFAACPLDEAAGRLKEATGVVTPVGPLEPDHPDPIVAMESNRVFAALSVAARARVTHHRDDGHGSIEQLRGELESIGLQLVEQSEAGERHVVRVAHAVAVWTWKHWKRRRRMPQKRLTRKERHAARAAAGRATAAARGSATAECLTAAARQLLTAGQRITQAAVAAASGRSLRTIERHWTTIMAALAA
jgi:hypothetical protein